jgi:signal transduction histidine kinase
LRAQLLVALSPLLVALLVVVILGSKITSELGHSSRRIANENYASVVAAERMKDAVEEMDRVASLSVARRPPPAPDLSAAARARFQHELEVELNNITEPGEAEKAAALRDTWEEYQRRFDEFSQFEGQGQKERFYFQRLYPELGAVERAAEAILDLNQEAMLAKSAQAELEARRWNRIVLAVGMAGTLLALLASTTWMTRLLRPLSILSAASRRIGQGDLGARAVVRGSHEVAGLARDFNDMAQKLETYRKSSLGQLLQAQQNLQATIDSMPDPVLVVNLDGSLVQGNRASQALLGFPRESPDASWTAPLAAPLRDAIDKARTHALSGRGPFLPQGLKDAVAVESPEGPRRFLVRAEPAYDEDGAVAGTTLVLQDVTRMARMDELRSNLVATVAHEFRTPLTSIRMAIHLCTEGVVGPLTPKQTDLLFTAREECERLQTIVDELLDASRMDTGKLVLHRAAAPVEILVDAAVDAHRPAAESRAVQLRAEVLPGLGAVFVDRDQMNILFSNLITNAVHHSPAGAVVTVGATRAGDTIEFEVRDEGPGIAPEHQEAVFESHFQVPGARRGGAGLGLAIARRIVEEHGGVIGVTSKPGAGARFWFRLRVMDGIPRQLAG